MLTRGHQEGGDHRARGGDDARPFADIDLGKPLLEREEVVGDKRSHSCVRDLSLEPIDRRRQGPKQIARDEQRDDMGIVRHSVEGLGEGANAEIALVGSGTKATRGWFGEDQAPVIHRILLRCFQRLA